jgi:uncharacterized membrane protein
MNIQDWFNHYFIETGYGYNSVNTTVYGILLIIFVYIIYRILKKLQINVDKRLALSIAPFVIFGSSIRILEDANIISGYFFVTPGIYFLIFGITFLTLLISWEIEKKFHIPYHKIMFIVGLILTSPVLGVLKYNNFLGISYVLLYFAPWIIVLKLIPWLKENKIVTGLHVFDGTVTFVSLNYFGYYEQHVLPRYLINLFGTPFSFIFLKILIIVAVLFFIDKYSEDKDFNNFIKLVIGILGAATGTRDFLRLFYLT